jgi:hypothetical protein
MLRSLRLSPLIPGIDPTLGDIERPRIGNRLDASVYTDSWH